MCEQILLVHSLTVIVPFAIGHPAIGEYPGEGEHHVAAEVHIDVVGRVLAGLQAVLSPVGEVAHQHLISCGKE